MEQLAEDIVNISKLHFCADSLSDVVRVSIKRLFEDNLQVVSILKLCHFGLTVPCASMWLPCVWIARSGRVTLSMSYRFPISPQGSEPRWWSSIWLLTHRAPNSAPSTDAILVACLIFNQQSEL